MYVLVLPSKATIFKFLFLVMSTQREAADSDGGDEDSDNNAESSTSRKRKRQNPTTAETDSKSRKRKKGQKKNDKEYGVSRGVDFVDVSCVINFDLPSSSRSYTHRVGRTARAGRTGMSLSFVVPQEEWGKNKVVGCVESTKKDEKVFTRIEKEQAARGSKIKEYQFDMKQVEAFRYRMEDALRAVTRSAIREARLKELKSEILNSEKLKVLSFCAFLEPSLPTHPSFLLCRLISKTIPMILSTFDTINRFTPPVFSHT